MLATLFLIALLIFSLASVAALTGRLKMFAFPALALLCWGGYEWAGKAARTVARTEPGAFARSDLLTIVPALGFALFCAVIGVIIAIRRASRE